LHLFTFLHWFTPTAFFSFGPRAGCRRDLDSFGRPFWPLPWPFVYLRVTSACAMCL
jgi:hypothetical protein